jgi:hypothetical protein
VEVDTKEQLEALLTLPDGTIDFILCDNFGPEALAEVSCLFLVYIEREGGGSPHAAYGQSKRGGGGGGGRGVRKGGWVAGGKGGRINMITEALTEGLAFSSHSLPLSLSRARSLFLARALSVERARARKRERERMREIKEMIIHAQSMMNRKGKNKECEIYENVSTYKHACIQTFMHACIHAYICKYVLVFDVCLCVFVFLSLSLCACRL